MTLVGGEGRRRFLGQASRHIDTDARSQILHNQQEDDRLSEMYRGLCRPCLAQLWDKIVETHLDFDPNPNPNPNADLLEILSEPVGKIVGTSWENYRNRQGKISERRYNEELLSLELSIIFVQPGPSRKRYWRGRRM